MADIMNIKVIAIIVLLCTISAEAEGNPWSQKPKHEQGSDNVSAPANSVERRARSAAPKQFYGAFSKARRAIIASFHVPRS